MGSKKKRNLDRKGRKFENMISCPVCGASSYPRVFRDPQNKQEAQAVMCGACGIDLRPIIEYHQPSRRHTPSWLSTKINLEKLQFLLKF